MEDKFWEWLNENATMYRGNNASDCMLAAWKAGVEAERERCAELADNWKSYEHWNGCGEVAAAIRGG